MKVRRNNNFIECIMNSEDLEKYDLNISELKDPNSKDKIGEKLNEILEDINEELPEDEKMTFDSPMKVEMLIGNADNILIQIHTSQIQEKDDFLSNQKSVFDKNEVKDLVFSFHTLDDCILFAKQIHNLSLLLIEKSKTISEDDLMMVNENELEIPDYIPDFLVDHFNKLRKTVVEQINYNILDSFEAAKNFEGFETSLHKMNDTYYFICKDVSFNSLNGVPEEFYLNDITNEPIPAYIEEHGEVIIKEKAAESLAML